MEGFAAAENGRRKFITWFLGTSVGALFGAILYPLFRFVSPPRVPEASTNQIEAGAVNDPELLEKGFKIIRFGMEPVILIRVTETEFRALSATCTHLDCTVKYRPDLQKIHCACHNGMYDLEGRNVSGPPPRPLTPYTVQVSGDDIYVSRA